MQYQELTLQSMIHQNASMQLFCDKFEIPQSERIVPIKQLKQEGPLKTEIIQVLLKTYDEHFEFPYEELNTFSIAELLDYLKLTHRFYLQKKLPEIEQTIQNLFQDYATADPLLVILYSFFVQYKAKLERHIRFEEKSLFPYIETLLEIEAGRENVTLLEERYSGFSAKQFLTAHNDVEEDLKTVRQTIEQHIHQHKIPLPFRIFQSQLQHFEIDLCKHAIIEDEILLPKVLELEQQWI